MKLFIVIPELLLLISLQCCQEVGETRPILVLGTDSGFGSYICEILRTEGFNEYEKDSLGSPDINRLFLKSFKTVILGKTQVDAASGKLLTAYVRKGGNLIAFEPDTLLNEIFGVKTINEALNEGYLEIDTMNSLGTGLTGSTMRFHGPAIVSSLTSGKKIASLYPDQDRNKVFPAVVLNNYGSGKAIAFMYNLPESVVYTRQGNPELAGIESDSIPGIRAMDLFTNGWVDTSMNELNQADEQMRLLSHCIETLAGSALPLPKLWYFPDALQSLIVLTNDGEFRQETDFEKQFNDIDSACSKMTLYVLETGKVSKSWVNNWVGKGFEISGHPDDTHEASDPTWTGMSDAIGIKKKEVLDKYGFQIRTVANHWFVWCGRDMNGNPDFTGQAEIEAEAGLKLDANYAHYDNNSNQPGFLGKTGYGQGNFTGSGLPMKFAGENGKVLEVYQFLTNVYDQQYMENRDACGFFGCFMGLLDRSLNKGVYSVIGIKAHNDEYFFTREPLLKMLSVADSLKIPVWTAEKLLDFLEMKDKASFSHMNWKRNVFSFVIKSPITGTGALTLMLPLQFKGRMIIKVMEEEKEIPFFNKRIKGRSYAMIPVESGNVLIYYRPAH